MVTEMITLLVLFVLSGFFSGSETALTTVSKARVSAYLKAGRAGAKALHKLKSNTNRMLVAILIGNNLVNIAASAMATVIATDMFGDIGAGLAVGVLTIIILVFGEVTPKTFAARHAGPIALFVSPPLQVFTLVAMPLVWILEQLTVLLHRLSRARTEPTVTESELIHMAEHGALEGTIELDEQKMIERIFAFDDLLAQDVMIPRGLVFLLDGRRSIRDALPEILDHPYMRLPLTSGNEDEVTGIVYLKEVLEAVVNGDIDKPLKDIGKSQPLYVPVIQPIEELFTTLRQDAGRLVVVVSEYGTLEGIFTLEDMLEELVGEIHDERDRPTHQTQEVREGELLVDGTQELRVVEDFLGVDLVGKATDPVSLWILNHTEYIPSVGERFTIDGLDVVVEKATRRHVKQVRIIRSGGGGTVSLARKGRK